MNALALLLTLTSLIVLRSGDRIAVEGAVKEENGVITFRSGGALYSMPSQEVERIEKIEPQPETPKVRKLAVSEEQRRRLIDELEKNHAGSSTMPELKPLPDMPPAEPANEHEENSWRRQARNHQEAIRQAREELALLESRVNDLQSQIQGFVSLGYRPRQFTYQTTQLEQTREQLPYAKLAVTRAERAYDEFREDARRQGVLPGWLR
jgi:DNA repair exonuclease SbcCD ATPase subunit